MKRNVLQEDIDKSYDYEIVFLNIIQTYK